MTVQLRLGNPAHGGFCVARNDDGRVVFVRHGLPGELVVAEFTEDRGKSFARADAIDVLEPSPDRVEPLCDVSAPGGAGCCDFSHATSAAQRAIKKTVVAEQLLRLARVEIDFDVEELAGTGNGGGWRTRVRFAVDADGRAGVHRYRGSAVLPDLRCPQPVPGAVDGLADMNFTPGAELQVAVDSAGTRHLVELAPQPISRTGRRSPGRRGAMARRSAAARHRAESVVAGSGRAVERVGDRAWEVAATGFWQGHVGAADAYAAVVREWAAGTGVAWDLYSGAGVFAAQLAASASAVVAVESSRSGVEDARRALSDLPNVRFEAGRVEQIVGGLTGNPEVVVLDPPRSGAGRDVVAAVTGRTPERIVHIGCDPAAFGRDVGLYQAAGYRLAQLRAFDAFPLTHHVECVGLLVRS